MSDPIVISDSSDDEEVIPPPSKKIKHEITIEKVPKKPTSPVNNLDSKDPPDEDSDVIEIESDNEENVTPIVQKSENKSTKTQVFYVVQDDKKLADLKPVGIDIEDLLVKEFSKKENIEENLSEKSSENDCDIVEITDDVKENIPEPTKNENQEVSSETKNQKKVSLNGKSIENPKNDSEELKKSVEPKENSEKPVENCECPSAESEKLLEDLIQVCTSAHIEKKLRIVISEKVEKIKIRYKSASVDYVNSVDFKNLVLKQIRHVKKKPCDAAVCFREVWCELNAHRKREILLNYNQDRHVRKLEKTLKKLDKAIKSLEVKEVDFDDEGDSTYVQLERYKARFALVYKKYCSILKSDEYAGRILHQKLDFSASKYPEINRAIDKFYQKNKQMPNISEVDKILRKTIKESKLNLDESKIDSEVRAIHKALGNLIQRRRKSELDDVMNGFLGSETDPAMEDQELKEKLDKQLKEGEKKLDSVFEMYTKKQLQGENPEVSSDSDDSHLAESGEDAEKDDLEDQNKVEEEGQSSKQ